MSIGGGHPGETSKVKCVANDGKTVKLSGDGVIVVLSGPKVDYNYFKVGQEYVAHFRPAGDGKPYPGSQEGNG
jgi:hypothetical protein